MHLLVKDHVSGLRELPKELAIATAYTVTAFGMGGGAVTALGFTSSAAIGAIATVMSLGVVFFFICFTRETK